MVFKTSLTYVIPSGVLKEISISTRFIAHLVLIKGTFALLIICVFKYSLFLYKINLAAFVIRAYDDFDFESNTISISALGK